jgi:hypothetical protein
VKRKINAEKENKFLNRLQAFNYSFDGKGDSGRSGRRWRSYKIKDVETGDCGN